jgi:hypothetical protein
MAVNSSQFEVEYVECPLGRASALRSSFEALASVLDDMVAEAVGDDHFYCVASSAPIADSRIGAIHYQPVALSAD